MTRLMNIVFFARGGEMGLSMFRFWKMFFLHRRGWTLYLSREIFIAQDL